MIFCRKVSVTQRENPVTVLGLFGKMAQDFFAEDELQSPTFFFGSGGWSEQELYRYFKLE